LLHGRKRTDWLANLALRLDQTGDDTSFGVKLGCRF
jgi:hypothetical protein